MATSNTSCTGPTRGAERGFTLLELIVAMAVFGLVGLGIFGVLVLGARSAGSGERITEQARRYRIANEVIARQVASTEPMLLPRQDDGELGGEDDESSAEPFYLGESEQLEFVTAAPQRPDATGMAIVRYWVEDGTLMMSERPVFSAYGARKKGGRSQDDDSLRTILLYDVASVTFGYQRASDNDQWLETWSGIDEEMLPACVRIDVRPSATGGPDFYHEMPVLVGTFNQITDADEDFRSRRVRRGGGGGGGGPQPTTPQLNDDETPTDTAPEPEEEED